MAERIRNLFREQDITIFSVLTAISMTISTIVLAITGVLGEGGGAGSSPSKDERVLKKNWLGRLADPLKRLVRKAAKVLPAIVGSVVGAILSFLEKTVGFSAEHTWALIVFVAGRICVWLMQRYRGSKAELGWSWYLTRILL